MPSTPGKAAPFGSPSSTRGGGASSRGKTDERTDTFQGRFVRLIPNEQIAWATAFESADPSFAGEMIVSWTLAPSGSGTRITVVCENIPAGIRPEDNEAGCRSTLEKLAAFLSPPLAVPG